MVKRKLTKQQRVRISANQQNESEAREMEGGDTLSRKGLVISHFGQQLEVEPLSGSHTSRSTIRCFQRTNLPSLVTGDKVIFQADSEDTGIILSAEPRVNVFARPGFKGQIKPVAANIDIVVVVVAVLPEPFTNLTDRYLVAIESLGLKPLIVLNKADLVTKENAASIDSMMSMYQSIGYATRKVSADTGVGLDKLGQLLSGKTTVLVGQSGVGKSSLVNGLSQQDNALVGRLSVGKEKGTHTTTTARLFHLGEFDLVDSPGIREFNLGHIEHSQLIAGYPELNALKGSCKFRDCGHQSEPGCAILAGVQEGLVFPQRLSNYFQILQTIAN
ncbi:MAG: small ribosomal subunit biogenesis GTPase RsgA [Pseudohongiellaceae bacterium]